MKAQTLKHLAMAKRNRAFNDFFRGILARNYRRLRAEGRLSRASELHRG